MSDRAALLLQRLLDGDADAVTHAWLRSGLLRWLKGDVVSLPVALHLPSAPFRVRLQIRDLWLRAAAQHLVESPHSRGGALVSDRASPWSVARRLRFAVEAFRGVHWPGWKREAEPPWGRASRVECCLFYAFRAGASMPETVQAFCNILEADQATARDDLVTFLQRLQG